MPLVSVCIPVHNMGRYVGDAIRSVLDQDQGDFELIVCDDASSDETPAIAASFEDRRLRYCRHDARVGQAANFNRCLRVASGEFTTILHADDLLLLGFLSDRASRLLRAPETAFVFGAVDVIDAEGRKVGLNAPWSEDRRFSSREMLETLLRACVVCPPSLMVRRTCAVTAGPFREDLTWGHDWEWTMRLATTGSAEYVAEPRAAYRVHDGSGTADMLKAAKNGAQERQILADTLIALTARDGTFRRSRRDAFANLGRRHLHYAHLALERGQKAVVRHNLGWAARADLSLATKPTYWLLALASLGLRSPYTRWARFRGLSGNP